jgi:flagellin FlaB
MAAFRKLLARAAREERGITGLETAIILIAFVVVATVFAFVVLTTGVFSSERGKETVFAGLQKARGTMEIRGGIVLTSTAGTVNDIQFAVSTAAGGDPIPLDPVATTNRTVIAYRDAATVDNDVVYTVTPIVGDGDNLLEPGEVTIVTIDRATGISPAPTMLPNIRFTFEVQTPVGAVLDITRQLPASIDPVVQLH